MKDKFSLKSKYVKFARAYCDKVGLYTYNEFEKKREYDSEDIFLGILAMSDHERRNRKGK